MMRMRWKCGDVMQIAKEMLGGPEAEGEGREEERRYVSGERCAGRKRKRKKR